MIPFEKLLETMEKFNSKKKEVKAECDAATKGGECHINFYKMHQAFLKLQNVVEMDLLPFVEGASNNGESLVCSNCGGYGYLVDSQGRRKDSCQRCR